MEKLQNDFDYAKKAKNLITESLLLLVSKGKKKLHPMIFEALLNLATIFAKKARKALTMPKIHKNFVISSLIFNYLNLNNHSLSLIRTLRLLSPSFESKNIIFLIFLELAP